MSEVAFARSDASEIITTESPILNSACMILPSGRIIGSNTGWAPKASFMKRMTLSAPSTTRYGVMVWNPSGTGFTFVAIGNLLWAFFEDRYQRGTDVPVRPLFTHSLYKV